MKSMINKWHLRYLALAAGDIASWSKDPSTKVGAVIVNSDNKIIGTGYNGLPRGMDDRKITDREFKIKHVVHAEMNAIFNSTCNVKGATLYISHPPCAQCAKLINAAGIKRVLWLHNEEFAERWDSNDAEDVFAAGGVDFTKVK